MVGGGEVAVTPYNLVTRADGFFRISTETALSTEMEPIHTENDPTYTGIESIYCLTENTESKVDGFLRLGKSSKVQSHEVAWMVNKALRSLFMVQCLSDSLAQHLMNFLLATHTPLLYL